MRTLYIKYIIGLLLLTSGFANAGDAPSSSKALCKVSAGAQFCVPDAYLPWGLDPLSEAFLIEVRYPSYTPLPEHKRSAHERDATILIYFDHHKNHHQSANAVAYRLQANPVKSEALDSNGLRPTERAGGNVIADIFYAPDADPRGSQPELIRCNVHQAGAAYAQAHDCVMHFRHDEHYFDVRIRRAWLPQWRNIKAQAINLFSDFKTRSFKE